MVAYLKYIWLTIRHKTFVVVAGLKIGGIPFWRLLLHDASKFGPSELPHYSRQFFGDKSDPEGFSRAWIHHQNHNPHHWEYWIPRTVHERSDGNPMEPVQMPEVYVREMIADWYAAGKAYTGKWDAPGWYEKNKHKIILHQFTEGRVETILRDTKNKFS